MLDEQFSKYFASGDRKRKLLDRPCSVDNRVTARADIGFCTSINPRARDNVSRRTNVAGDQKSFYINQLSLTQRLFQIIHVFCPCLLLE